MLLKPKEGLLLPEYSEDDYEIILKTEAGLKTEPIYTINAQKKKALREYIDKNLKRGYIRQSKLRAA